MWLGAFDVSLNPDEGFARPMALRFPVASAQKSGLRYRRNQAERMEAACVPDAAR